MRISHTSSLTPCAPRPRSSHGCSNSNILAWSPISLSVFAFVSPFSSPTVTLPLPFFFVCCLSFPYTLLLFLLVFQFSVALVVSFPFSRLFPLLFFLSLPSPQDCTKFIQKSAKAQEVMDEVSMDAIPEDGTPLTALLSHCLLFRNGLPFRPRLSPSRHTNTLL